MKSKTGKFFQEMKSREIKSMSVLGGVNEQRDVFVRSCGVSVFPGDMFMTHEHFFPDEESIQRIETATDITGSHVIIGNIFHAQSNPYQLNINDFCRSLRVLKK